MLSTLSKISAVFLEKENKKNMTNLSSVELAKRAVNVSCRLPVDFHQISIP